MSIIENKGNDLESIPVSRSMENQKVIELAGWVGIGLILLAYTGVSLDQLNADSFVYQLLNLVGSILVVWQTWHRRNYQPMVLNIVWAIVALIALFRAF